MPPKRHVLSCRFLELVRHPIKILTSVVCHKETNPICRTMLSASTVGAQKDQECHEVKGEATPQGPWPSCKDHETSF